MFVIVIASLVALGHCQLGRPQQFSGQGQQPFSGQGQQPFSGQRPQPVPGQGPQPAPGQGQQIEVQQETNLEDKVDENLINVDTSIISEGVESCLPEALENCLDKASMKCWRGAYGGLYPPVIRECEHSFNKTFKYIDGQMRKCLDRKNLQNLCSYVRSSKVPESLDRQRREAIFGDDKAKNRKKRQAAPGETERQKQNMEGLLDSMNENKANQLPHEEDKENREEEAVKQKFFDAAKCWDDEEEICYNSYNQMCGITNEMLAKVEECEEEEGIKKMEHTVGVRVSVCVQERLVHAGLQCYFSKLAADEQEKKEKEAKEAEEKAEAKPDDAAANAQEAKPQPNVNEGEKPNAN